MKNLVSPAQAGYNGFATSKAMNFSLKLTKTTSEIISIFTDSENESHISSKLLTYSYVDFIFAYSEAMQMILSADSPDSEDLNDQNFLEIYQSAMDLYGLIHARFILTPRGLALMKEKYMLSAFSYCPRVLCERHNVLPIGVSEELSTSRVKVYCPRC